MKVMINDYNSFSSSSIETEKIQGEKENNTYHIYDKIFKRILTLSKKAVIELPTRQQSRIQLDRTCG